MQYSNKYSNLSKFAYLIGDQTKKKGNLIENNVCREFSRHKLIDLNKYLIMLNQICASDVFYNKKYKN